jgi:DNA-binding MarR family transcriptional regulator
MPKLSLIEFADKLNDILPAMLQGFARQQANELYKGKITLPQFLILESLNRAGESKMSVLAHSLHVTTAAMTGIVDRLVRDGYCLRQDDPEDRRIVKVKLSSGGRELVKKINAQRRQMILGIFSRISEDDRVDYLRILTQIKEILVQEAKLK